MEQSMFWAPNSGIYVPEIIRRNVLYLRMEFRVLGITINTFTFKKRFCVFLSYMRVTFDLVNTS